MPSSAKRFASYLEEGVVIFSFHTDRKERGEMGHRLFSTNIVDPLRFRGYGRNEQACIEI
jgi:hypothetical protein